MKITGYTPIERPVLPVRHLVEHSVGDLRDRLTADVGRVHLHQMRFDLTGRQTFRRQRDDHRIDPVEAPLTLLHRFGFERPVTISRHVDLDRADLGDHRLGPGAVAGVVAVAAVGCVLFVADVILHLDFRTGLENLLGQIGQQAARAHQVNPISACLVDELLCDRALIGHLDLRRRRHRHIMFCHCLSFRPSPSAQRFRPDQLHQGSDSPWQQARCGIRLEHIATFAGKGPVKSSSTERAWTPMRRFDAPSQGWASPGTT
jgi:hypothetical protein